MIVKCLKVTVYEKSINNSALVKFFGKELLGSLKCSFSQELVSPAPHGARDAALAATALGWDSGSSPWALPTICVFLHCPCATLSCDYLMQICLPSRLRSLKMDHALCIALLFLSKVPSTILGT